MSNSVFRLLILLSFFFFKPKYFTLDQYKCSDPRQVLALQCPLSLGLRTLFGQSPCFKALKTVMTSTPTTITTTIDHLGVRRIYRFITTSKIHRALLIIVEEKAGGWTQEQEVYCTQAGKL